MLLTSGARRKKGSGYVVRITKSSLLLHVCSCLCLSFLYPHPTPAGGTLYHNVLLLRYERATVPYVHNNQRRRVYIYIYIHIFVPDMYLAHHHPLGEQVR